MNNTHALLLALSLVLLAGCEQEDSRQKMIAQHDERVWMKSSLGVKYFYDCIDGIKFIIISRHYGYGISGPLGECE